MHSVNITVAPTAACVYYWYTVFSHCCCCTCCSAISCSGSSLMSTNAITTVLHNNLNNFTTEPFCSVCRKCSSSFLGGTGSSTVRNVPSELLRQRVHTACGSSSSS